MTQTLSKEEWKEGLEPAVLAAIDKMGSVKPVEYKRLPSVKLVDEDDKPGTFLVGTFVETQLRPSKTYEGQNISSHSLKLIETNVPIMTWDREKREEVLADVAVGELVSFKGHKVTNDFFATCPVGKKVMIIYKGKTKSASGTQYQSFTIVIPK